MPASRSTRMMSEIACSIKGDVKKILHLRTRASPEPTDHHQQRSPEMEGALHPRRSSGLRFQFFCVEVLSLLPRVSVIAAILRASVRRAIVGLMPLASAA